MANNIKTIWSVDDDEIFLLLTSNYIKTISFQGEYKTFIDGHFAIEAIKENITQPDNLPDVILLDINMPMVDAWEFMEIFKDLALPKKIYIYIVSSSIDPADRQKSESYQEIQSFIEKPVNGDKLLMILNNHE